MKGSEAFKPFHSVRYRPVYYALRYLEVYLWGGNALLWYMARIIFFAISCLFLTKLSKLLFLKDGLFQIFFISIITSAKFWPDLFSRLGPAETYASPILCFLLYATVHFFRGERSPGLIILITIFSTMAVGIKENFWFTVFINFYLAIQLFREKDKLCWLQFIPFMFTAFVSLAVIIPLLERGTDIYMNSVSAFERLFFFLRGFSSKTFLAYSTLLFVMLLKWKREKRLNKETLLFSSIGMLMYLIQTLYYANNFGWTRYAFPAYLFTALILTYLLYSLRIYILSSSKLCGVLLALVFCFYSYGIVNNLKYCLKNVRETSNFNHSLNNLKEVTAKNKSPIVFIIRHAYDYEPFLSSLIFFSHYDIENDFMIYISDEAYQTNNKPLFIQLLKSLGSLQRYGLKDNNASIPYTYTDECIAINNSKKSPLHVCKEQLDVEYTWQ